MPAAQAAHAVRDKRRHSLKLATDKERRRLSSLPSSERDIEAAVVGISLSTTASRHHLRKEDLLQPVSLSQTWKNAA